MKKTNKKTPKTPQTPKVLCVTLSKEETISTKGKELKYKLIPLTVNLQHLENITAVIRAALLGAGD